MNVQLTYPATPEQVFAMLLDPAFQERVCSATGALSHSVDVQESAGGAVITTSREFPTDDFPSMVQKFVGATVTVRRTDHWGTARPDGSRHGTVAVQIGGAPVNLTGTLVLHAAGGGTAQDIHGDLTASVPFVGGKIEKAAEPAIRTGIDKEGEIGRRWLASPQ